ncbi:uncharacterized protein LOC141649619 [Silene latifolia]|uniref:uncharacterized protein LOC141649619 n=1 Tax=Silene latifolia TaxID=37657 RepID=UPI003D77EEFB
MVWNIQGTRNKNKINVLKEVIKTYKPFVLALVETHMNGDHVLKIQKIIGYNGHHRVDVVGFSGGIWLYWKPEIITVTPISSTSQFVTVEITRNGELPWLFSAVYASPNPNNYMELWTELENFAITNNQPWLLAGDYNETRSITERHGWDSNMACRCALFNKWIENCQLIELEFSGPSHTWTRGNSTETRQSARFDRAVCNSEWSIWNEEVFENIFRQKRELLARIEGCQKALSLRRNSYLIKHEAQLRKKLDEVLESEELLWYQKSRVDFIKDGDRNTSYFQVSTLVRRWRNRINSLKDSDGNWVLDSNEVNKMVVDFYKNLYIDDSANEDDVDIPYDLFPEFSNEHWDWLTKYYSLAEV